MAHDSWPQSKEDLQDHHTVVDLVRTVGEQKLVWTIYDIQRERKRNPRLNLNDSSQVSRHVHLLDDRLVTRVDRRLDAGQVKDESRPTRARHQFVLTSRLPEYNGGAVSIDDLERIYFALWVALVVLGIEEVPTRTVTDVLRNVEALALVTPRNTANHLKTLEKRNQQLVEQRKDGRWSMWRPVGPKPDHPDFQDWVRAFDRATEGGEAPPTVGHATVNALGHELLRRALHHSRSSTWPAGHSVQITHIRSAVGKDERAQELASMLRKRGRSMGSVLGDLTKQRIAGRDRVEKKVVKVGSVRGNGTYYDAPGEPGYERRRLIYPYKSLQEELSSVARQQLAAEAREAERLRITASSEVLRTIGTVRLLLVHRQLDPAEALLELLEGQSELLGKTIRKSVRNYRSQLNELIERLPSREVIQEEAEHRLSELGLDIETVLSAERPLMTPHDYVGFVSPHIVGDLSPSEFLHRVITLRRFDNPSFVLQTDSDPARSARYCVDRADALCYLAERYQGRVYSFLRSGLSVLGRDLRSPELVKALLNDPQPAHRHSALAALVLLASPEAVHVAEQWLHEAERPEDLIAAMHALLVLGEADEIEWPQRIRSTRSPLLRKALTDTVLAARTGRRLLQR